MDVPDRQPDRGRAVDLLRRRQAVRRDHRGRHADLVGRRPRRRGLQVFALGGSQGAVAAAEQSRPLPAARPCRDARGGARPARRGTSRRPTLHAARPPAARGSSRGPARTCALECEQVERADRSPESAPRRGAGARCARQRRRLRAALATRGGGTLPLPADVTVEPGRHPVRVVGARRATVRGRRALRARARQALAAAARRPQRRLPRSRPAARRGSPNGRSSSPAAPADTAGRRRRRRPALHVPAPRHDHRRRRRARSRARP